MKGNWWETECKYNACLPELHWVTPTKGWSAPLPSVCDCVCVNEGQNVSQDRKSL